VVPVLTIADFGARLFVITLLTSAVWIVVMLATRPEDDATLDAFYARVRPGGPGWARQRQRTGLAPAVSLRRSVLRTVAAGAVLFGAMFGLGGALLLNGPVAGGMTLVALAGGVALARLRDPAPATAA
jgi:hypothetical protein